MNDYVPLEAMLSFHPQQEDMSHCVAVTVLDDRFVERMETFEIVLTSDDPGVVLAEGERRAVVIITDEDGKSIHTAVYGDTYKQTVMSRCVLVPTLSISCLMLGVVVCEKEGMDTSRGFFDWPEAFSNEVVRLPCVNGSAIRVCDANGNWETPSINNCYATVDAIIKHIITVRPTVTNTHSPAPCMHV